MTRNGFRNFNQLLLYNFSRFRERPALSFKVAGRYTAISYGRLEETCMCIAAGLIRRGLKPGDRIAMLSGSRPEWAYADLGAILAGAVSSGIYTTALSEEVGYILKDLDARFVFVEDLQQLEKIKTVIHAIPSIQHIFMFTQGIEDADARVCPFAELLQAGAAGIAEARMEAGRIAAGLAPADPMCIVYTSGTTGKPKGAILTQANYLETCRIVEAHIGDTRRLKKNISFLPLAHAFERFAGYYLVLYLGRCIAYAETVDTLLENFKEVRPNFAVAVPRVFEKIHARILHGARQASPARRKLFYWALENGQKAARLREEKQPLPPLLWCRLRLAGLLVFRKLKAALGGRMVFFVSGGAPLNPSIARFFYAMDIFILEGWGMTEATTPCTLNRPGDFRFGTVGKALPGVRIRTAADGELEAAGPNIFSGYWKKPQETADCFTEDGYYRTGDIGEIDAGGWVSITGRKKQLIITSGGKNIAPVEIEQQLLAQPHIEMCYIHGDRRKYLTALIVPDRAAAAETAGKLNLADLAWEEFVRHPQFIKIVQQEVDTTNLKLSRHMQIKYFRLLAEPFSVESGEMTHTLKLKKEVIEKKYQTLLDSMYPDGDVGQSHGEW
ncbi:MAG: long-chain fatty acid--CoA ligase [Thermodesulfobacteriota bacterium]